MRMTAFNGGFESRDMPGQGIVFTAEKPRQTYQPATMPA
jgi:hypothetical protein